MLGVLFFGTSISDLKLHATFTEGREMNKQLVRILAIGTLLAAAACGSFSKGGSSNPLSPAKTYTVTLTLTGANAIGEVFSLGTYGKAKVGSGLYSHADEKGVLVFGGLEPGSYAITVASDYGFSPKVVDVVISDKSILQTVQLVEINELILYKMTSSTTAISGSTETIFGDTATFTYPAHLHYYLQVWMSNPSTTKIQLGLALRGALQSSRKEGIVRSVGLAGSRMMEVPLTNYRPCTGGASGFPEVCVSDTDEVVVRWVGGDGKDLVGRAADVIKKSIHWFK